MADDDRKIGIMRRVSEVKDNGAPSLQQTDVDGGNDDGAVSTKLPSDDDKKDEKNQDCLEYTPDCEREIVSQYGYTIPAKCKESSVMEEKTSISLSVPSSCADVVNDGDLEVVEEDEETGISPNNEEFLSLPRPPRQEHLPGAFHSEDGRNARDLSVAQEEDMAVQSLELNAPVQELTARPVDTELESRIVHERVNKVVDEKIRQQAAELEKNTEVAEIVTGFWCSPRLKRLIAVGIMLSIVAAVLCTILVLVLKPAPPKTPIESLMELLSSVSFDDGDALRTTSTPQHNAFNWLADDPNLGLYSDEKKVQRFAFATLYFSTTGENWYENDDWLRYDDECLWYKTACTNSSLVRLLELSGNNLNGTIPDEIALLSNSLVKIDLGQNRLLGTIPSELGLLTHLVDLQLDDNELSGVIPFEFGLLIHLEQLHLSNNNFSGTIPSEVGHLTQLGEMRLSLNTLSGPIPSEIGLLTDMESLSLSNNTFSGTVHSEICFLTGLSDLHLFDNSFAGAIPSEIALLTDLWSLLVNGNSFTGTIPSEIGLLSRLNSLDLSNNNFTGTLPSEIGLITWLVDHGEWSLVDGLSGLNLENNDFTGTIPPEIWRLGEFLEYLNLSNNGFTGTIPSEVALLTYLQELYLFNNSFAGNFTCPNYIRECYISCFDKKCEYELRDRSVCIPQDQNSSCRSL